VLQYNFKIDANLKSELEKTLLESHSSNKSEFLGNMLKAYQAQKASSTQTELDLSKYESVSEEAKNAIGKSFKHILTLLDANSSTVKQEQIKIHEAYKSIKEVQENSTAEINAIKLDAEERISKAENKAEELAIRNKDLEAISKIATQVEFIVKENEALRAKAKLHEEEIKILNENNFKQKFSLTQKEKESKTQNKVIQELNQEISISQANLNQALGKLEILNS